MTVVLPVPLKLNLKIIFLKKNPYEISINYLVDPKRESGDYLGLPGLLFLDFH